MTNLASILALLVLLAVPGFYALPAVTGDDVATTPDLDTTLDAAVPDPAELTEDDIPGDRARREINPGISCMEDTYAYIPYRLQHHCNPLQHTVRTTCMLWLTRQATTMLEQTKNTRSKW